MSLSRMLLYLHFSCEKNFSIGLRPGQYGTFRINFKYLDLKVSTISLEVCHLALSAKRLKSVPYYSNLGKIEMKKLLSMLFSLVIFASSHFQ